MNKINTIIATLVLAVASMGCAAQGFNVAEIIHGPAESAEVAAVKSQERIAIATIFAALSQETISCEAGCTITSANEQAVAQMASALQEPTQEGFWSGVRDVSNTLITTAGGVINANAGVAAMGYLGSQGFKAIAKSAGDDNTINGAGTIGGGAYNPQTATPTVVDPVVVELRPEVVTPVVVNPVVVDPVVVQPTVIQVAS